LAPGGQYTGLVARATRDNTRPGGPKRTSGAPARPQAVKFRSAPADTGAASSSKPAKRPDFVKRLVAFGVVVVVLALSYASTIRLYFTQQHDLAVAEQQIAERTARVAQLQSQLDRWNDPAYVEAQARARLNWVMPGEAGYTVVDASGNVVPGTATEDEAATETAAATGPWWDRLWKAVQTADAPVRKVTLR
jgi:cell division protein FtsB